MSYNNAINATQNGLQSINNGIWNGRTITSSNGSLTISDGNGVLGNPDLIVTTATSSEGYKQAFLLGGM